MTNWMTAAGIALIAGGLATLISFRAVLFRGGERRAGRRRASTDMADLRLYRGGPDLLELAEEEPFLESLRGGGELDRPAGEFEEDFVAEPPPVAEFAPLSREFASVSAEFAPLSGEFGPLSGEFTPPSGEFAPMAGGGSASMSGEFAPPSVEMDGPAPEQRYGHRVDGWVRPEYPDLPDQSPAGEYWTPVPDDLFPDPEPSASGYGWPTPVERLPAVPSYGPVTPAPLAHEPTEVVMPGRVRLPRSWASRNENRRFEEPDRPTERRRPRPRPRPTARATDDTEVYVSRHAADPFR